MAQLIERYNAHRLGGPGDGLGLRKIVLGPDLDAWLERQGLTAASVPANGDFVRLQSVPRVADGGDVVGVIDRVHPDNAAIVRSVVELAKTLGLTCIAEGIETDDDLAQIRDLGCDVAQGFLIAQPLSAADAERLISYDPRW